MKDPSAIGKLLAKRIEAIAAMPGTEQSKLLLEKRLEALLNEIALTSGVPLHKWDSDIWKSKCKDAFRIILQFMEEEGDRLDVVASLQAAEQQRRTSDRNRVRDRPDQIKKRAFHKVVRAKLGNYSTITAAAEAFWMWPEFNMFPFSTILKWVREIWIKPIKKGRPKKEINKRKKL